MCHSWINAARQFQFELSIATPHQYRPDATLVDMAGDAVTVNDDPELAVRDADIVVTDTWASMGQESEKERRLAAFGPFRVNQRLMRRAKSDALFMHCLPAYRDYEVTAEVIDGPQSAVWAQAENRLHAQKALLEFLLLPQT
jgi:ornithine carbamoyltransferase